MAYYDTFVLFLLRTCSCN